MKRYKQTFKFFKASAGFSILGVLVASTIGAVAVLGLSQLSNVVANRAYRAQQMFNYILLSEEIKQTFMLGKPTPCTPPNPCWNSCSSSLINYNSGTPHSFVIRAPSINGSLTDLYWGGRPPNETKNIKIQEIRFIPGPLLTPPLPSDEAKAFIHFSLSDDTRETLVAPLSIHFHILLDDVQGGQIKECSIAGVNVAGSGPPDVPDGCRKVILEQTLIGCGGTEDNKDPKGTAFGYKSGYQSLGIGNTFFGFEAGRDNSLGVENTFLGARAGQKTFHNTLTNEGGSFNTFLGYEAGKDNTTGFHNIAIGQRARIPLPKRDNLSIGNLIEGTVLWTPRDQTKYPPAAPTFPEVVLKGQVEVEPPLASAFITAITAPTLSVNGQVWVKKRHNLPTPPDPAPEFKMETDGSHTNPSITIKTDGLRMTKVSTPEAGTTINLKMAGTSALPKVELDSDLVVKGPSTASGFGASARGGLALKSRDPADSDLLTTSVSGAGQWSISGNLEVDGAVRKTSHFGASLNIEKNLTVDEKGTFNNITVTKDRTFSEPLEITTRAVLEEADLTAGYTISTGRFGNYNITSLNHSSHTHTHSHGSRYSSSSHTRNPSFPPCVNRCNFCVSSRTLKRNIKPFQNYEKSLENIINTPVFTWQYKKDKGDHPEKVRMGLISEELPKDLQILDKDTPSTPDWLSIYGTLWAGIKALSKQLQYLKEKSAVKITELSQDLKKQFSDTITLFQKEITLQITTAKTQLAKLRGESQRQKQQTSKNNEELAELKKQFQKTNLILKNNEKELKNLQEELENARKTLKNLLRQKKKKSITKLENKKERGKSLLRGI
ncbi:MAG: hypothetical protein OXB86_04740 [Bdellovibrionales bacterium]|nr:hypothetical protein [Bdellovibrionales bacterium]